jgi:hypothetical protein
MRVRIPSVTKGPLILGRFETDSFLVQRLVVDPARERLGRRSIRLITVVNHEDNKRLNKQKNKVKKT